MIYGNAPCESMDMSCQQEFARVKDSLCMKLVNRDANAELPEKVPYRAFPDLEENLKVLVNFMQMFVQSKSKPLPAAYSVKKASKRIGIAEGEELYVPDYDISVL